ncbi:MAG: DUF262 domain-containing protein [Spirochaetes bacterium]|nr:DUF262 domain-containing protein [Spirochaetota bacterium]
MNNHKIHGTSFWKYLETYKIEIPIIQRDYAQGRIGKEKLREKFLIDLKEALDNKDKTLELDFVYGSIERGNLNPLDGQQRLTTLWLLHWYIAFKSGKLVDGNIIKRFKNFTYETRISSREFCEKLSEFNPLDNKDSKIVEEIENQTWFYSAWKQDPTIQAMLHMLGGTDIREKDAEIIDGIEELFKESDHKVYWERLASDEAPIKFYYLDLLGLKLTDDLYIKMNARGKALTDFENFKADLVGHIKELGFEKDKIPEETIAHKLDTTWMDIFWKFKSEENKIDEIYYAFINRYLLNYLIVAEGNKNGYLYFQEEIEPNKLFKYLDKDKENSPVVKYESFNIYKNDLKDENFDKYMETYLKKLAATLNSLHLALQGKDKNEIIKLFLPIWDEKSGFRFIPEYQNANDNTVKISTLTQRQRVVFYAICVYFENASFEEKTFRQWLRVVWNIVENTDVDNTIKMIGLIRLIDELRPGCNDIYSFLYKAEIKSNSGEKQVAEEKEKAGKIFNDYEWERKIIEAENYAFFKGAIRFLFRTGIKYDWTTFDARFEKAKEFFDKNGPREKYKKDSLLLRFIISNFSNWDQFSKIQYDNNVSSWKSILIDEKMCIPVNCIFENDMPDFAIWSSGVNNLNEKQKFVHNDLVQSPLLNHIENTSKLHWIYDKYCLYPSNAKSATKKVVVGDLRNEVLADLTNSEKIECKQKINDVNFFKGWEIEFILKCNNERYRWTRWNYLEVFDIKDNKWVLVKGIKIETLKEYLMNQS